MTWATSVPILVFLGFSILDLGPMYATDRQTSDAHRRLMAPTLGAGHNKLSTAQSKGFTASLWVLLLFLPASVSICDTSFRTYQTLNIKHQFQR